MTEIFLIFSMIAVNGPAIPSDPVISNKVFTSYEECAIFVNTIAQNDVVDENYEFLFASADGLLFKGGCYDKQQLQEKTV